MNNLQFVPVLHNHCRLMTIGLVLTTLLSACGNTTPTPPAESILSETQSVVAATVTAQLVVPATPTATLSPTATPTLYVPPTGTTTPTSQAWSWYWSYYGCEDSEFIKDITIPDGTVLAPGETFVKTWKFKNTGNCTWTSDFSIVFIDGDDMDGSDTEIDEKVHVSKKVEASVELTAPDDEGTYTGYWQLADEYGNTFGDIVYVEIVVSEDEATSTPTVIITSTSTPMPTYVSTVSSTPSYFPAATSTPTLSLMPTSTGTPTATDTPISTSTPTFIPSTPTPSAVPVSTDTPLPTDTPTYAPTSHTHSIVKTLS